MFDKDNLDKKQAAVILLPLSPHFLSPAGSQVSSCNAQGHQRCCSTLSQRPSQLYCQSQRKPGVSLVPVLPIGFALLIYLSQFLFNKGLRSFYIVFILLCDTSWSKTELYTSNSRNKIALNEKE